MPTTFVHNQKNYSLSQGSMWESLPSFEFHYPTKTHVLPPKIDKTIQEPGSMMVNQSYETKPMTASVDTIPIIFVYQTGPEILCQPHPQKLQISQSKLGQHKDESEREERELSRCIKY